MRGGLVLLFLVMVLLVSSCQQSAQSTNVGGIDIEFIENQPMSTLREGASFTVGLYLKNSLPESIYSVEVCVQDSFRDGNGGIYGQECQEIDISAAEVDGNTVSPEVARVYFPRGDGSYTYDNLGVGMDSVIILADIVYPVRTTSVVSDFCIKEDSGQDVVERECEANNIFVGEDIDNPIAPIVVDRVIADVVEVGSQNKVYSKIYFRKSPEGNVVHPDFHSTEGPTQPLVEHFVIGYDITLGSGEVFTCGNPDEQGFLVFDDLVEELVCEVPVAISGSWEDNSIVIELGYSYGVGVNHEIFFEKREEELI